MFYLSPKFHVIGLVAPYERCLEPHLPGYIRDATGKTVHPDHTYSTKADAIAAGRAKCTEQERRINRMSVAVAQRRHNLFTAERSP